MVLAWSCDEAHNSFLFELMAFACLTGERAFLHGTRCEFETIQFAINARGTVEYEFLFQ